MIGWSLAAISVVCGAGVAWLFQRTTDVAAIRATRKRMVAHLLEFRLYAGEPRLIWGAQLALIRLNLKLARLLAPPALILALPMAWLMLELDAVYGARPLAVGEAAVVTAQMRSAFAPLADARGSVTLEAPAGIAVETPPVRVFAERQISWRIRPTRPARGNLRLVLNGEPIEKSVAAGERGFFLFRRRWILRFPAGKVAWVDIDYPPAHWLAWFLVLSGASSLAFPRWFRRSV